MNTNITIVWCAIWASFAVAASFSKDSSIMAIPSIGMFVWWINA